MMKAYLVEFYGSETMAVHLTRERAEATAAALSDNGVYNVREVEIEGGELIDELIDAVDALGHFSGSKNYQNITALIDARCRVWAAKNALLAQRRGSVMNEFCFRYGKFEPEHVLTIIHKHGPLTLDAMREHALSAWTIRRWLPFVESRGDAKIEGDLVTCQCEQCRANPPAP